MQPPDSNQFDYKRLPRLLWPLLLYGLVHVLVFWSGPLWPESAFLRGQQGVILLANLLFATAIFLLLENDSLRLWLAKLPRSSWSVLKATILYLAVGYHLSAIPPNAPLSLLLTVLWLFGATPLFFLVLPQAALQQSGLSSWPIVFWRLTKEWRWLKLVGILGMLSIAAGLVNLLLVLGCGAVMYGLDPQFTVYQQQGWPKAELFTGLMGFRRALFLGTASLASGLAEILVLSLPSYGTHRLLILDSQSTPPTAARLPVSP